MGVGAMATVIVVKRSVVLTTNGAVVPGRLSGSGGDLRVVTVGRVWASGTGGSASIRIAAGCLDPVYDGGTFADLVCCINLRSTASSRPMGPMGRGECELRGPD
jgi:hypothetical protein